jgi:translation initiation factor 2 gamma subunit (eIF-2gamma)
MATTSARTVTVTFTGDVTGIETYNAATNVASPGGIIPVVTNVNTNTSVATAVAGTTTTSLTIIPPPGNTVQITLKGATGDTGILLHLTDPTSIALAPGQATIYLLTVTSITVKVVYS